MTVAEAIPQPPIDSAPKSFRHSTDYRVLVVDDNRSIHDDIRKVLSPPKVNQELKALEAQLFDEVPSSRCAKDHFRLSFATQGREALELTESATADGDPFALAFVDMRMPPGWDGVETIEHLWRHDPDLQVVICSAYSDHSWEEIAKRLGSFDQLLIIKKPFDNVEIVQAAHNLTHKWELLRAVRRQMSQLNALVVERTQELQHANQELAERLDTLQRMETELRVAQKLESVGQLAAGVAHEINTPAQFVSDNLCFVQKSLEELTPLLEAYRSLARGSSDECQRARQLEDDIDVGYLLREMPAAISQSRDGMAHVAKIVKAMRQFCHPGEDSRSIVDVNTALETTLTVARNEWKYVADLVTHLDPEHPTITGLPGELNQVFLNLVVNAAHAMADKYGDSGVKGTLTVTTRRAGEHVEILVEDTGTGIPQSAQPRIFDPFFTTKEVGKGTGQGLALAHSVVVTKHGGSLTFSTQEGLGTTFCVRLPTRPRGKTSDEKNPVC